MLIKHIKVSGLLSFGPKGIDLPMRPLNVLIGPNGSGKSNLIEVLDLLRESPSPRRSIAGPINDRGGVDEWLWKGAWNIDDAPPPAVVSVLLATGQSSDDVLHEIQFFSSNHLVRISDERIELVERSGKSSKTTWFYRMNPTGAGYRPLEAALKSGREIRRLSHKSIDLGLSILAQIRDPDRYLAFASTERRYTSIQIHRDWCFGVQSNARQPVRIDRRTDALEPGGLNLALMVAAMSFVTRARLVYELQQLFEGIRDIQSRPVAGSSLQLFLSEFGGAEIPASRLSDGTLRYLALLIILLDEEPPPLIAIEEPELGLHPDMLPRVASLLKEASQRTQLVVTTHSRLLIDCLGDDPESVIVCEKHEGESVFERLDGERMKTWLDEYSLGDLWSKGELGGNRW